MSTINLNGEECPILRIEIGSRGGGVEVDLSPLDEALEGCKMTAYQNYLGGGLLGSICSDCNRMGWEGDDFLVERSEELKQWFHEQTNPGTEFEGAEFDELQKRPVSAY